MLVRVETAALRRALASCPGLDEGRVAEMAVPSYLHRNPLIPWIVWRRLGAVLDLAGPRALAGRILDFGCGAGAFLPSLASTGRTVLGLDPEPGPARALLRELGLEVPVLGGDGLEGGVGPGELDLVVAVEVLEHLDEDLVPTLAALRTRLAPGGILVASLPTEGLIYGLARRVAGFSGHYHRRNATAVDAIVRGAGFRRTATRRLPFACPPWLFVVHRYEMEEAS